ncbi:FYVE finger containing protein [Phaffia rhodozyma]|uniref:FYVE finger containing protein n=1 Tax=Phaffia rhodozyma TaxID=264483 RepID=A0A0F7SVA6_PHARH|nr:FYVE finger containing protein [Phaffia rhodozyma]
MSGEIVSEMGLNPHSKPFVPAFKASLTNLGSDLPPAEIDSAEAIWGLNRLSTLPPSVSPASPENKKDGSVQGDSRRLEKIVKPEDEQDLLVKEEGEDVGSTSANSSNITLKQGDSRVNDKTKKQDGDDKIIKEKKKADEQTGEPSSLGSPNGSFEHPSEPSTQPTFSYLPSSSSNPVPDVSVSRITQSPVSPRTSLLGAPSISQKDNEEPVRDVKPELIFAITAGELYKVQRIFSSVPTSNNTLANEPLTPHTLIMPVHLASSHGKLDILKYLIEEGAAVDVQDAEGETALHKASLKGHLDIIAYLIEEKKVDPHARDSEGFTALHDACSRGYLDIVQFLCANSSAATYNPAEAVDGGQERTKGVDKRSKGGWTPLMCACANGHLPVVLYLVTKWRADPLMRNHFGETAFDVCAGVFEVFICEALQQFEAERWPDMVVPRAEPYNVLAVHSSVPIVVYENQRLDARLKTLAMSTGRPRFSSSGLGKKGRRSPWELRVPTGSFDTIGKPGDWEGVVPIEELEDINLPSLERPFVMPLPGTREVEEEEGWFWLSQFEVDLSNPRCDPHTGWMYAPTFSTPADQWLPHPPAELSSALTGRSPVLHSSLLPSPSSLSIPLPNTSSIEEQGAAKWVRRRVWVRISKRRLDVPALPFLEPDGLSTPGFNLDGSRVRSNRKNESLDSASALPVEQESSVRGMELEMNKTEDYLARARYLAGGRRRGSGGTTPGRSTDERTPATLKITLGKLERAVSGLRVGIERDSDEVRAEAAQGLLNSLHIELDALRLVVSESAHPEDVEETEMCDSGSETSGFLVPGESASVSPSICSPQGRGSTRSSSVSLSTEFYQVTDESPGIETQLSESATFVVPQTEAGIPFRRNGVGLGLNPIVNRPVWERDEDVSACRRCNRGFNFFLRKHHCRRCGQIVCHSCSQRRTTRLLPAEIVLDPSMAFSMISDQIHVPHRVCDPCFTEMILPLGRIGQSFNKGGEGQGRDRTGQTAGGSVAGATISSSRSDLADCPVCLKPLAEFGDVGAQERHVQECLEGETVVQTGRYLVYELAPDSTLIGMECVICLEEFEPGSKVARLNYQTILSNIYSTQQPYNPTTQQPNTSLSLTLQMDIKPRILLLGSTGYVGSSFLVSQLASLNGYEIVAVHRSSSVPSYMIHPRVFPLRGDLMDRTFIAQVSSDVDIVLSLANSDCPILMSGVLEGMTTRVEQRRGRRRPVLIHLTGVDAFVPTEEEELKLRVKGQNTGRLQLDDTDPDVMSHLSPSHPSTPIIRWALESNSHSIQTIVVAAGLIYGHLPGVTRIGSGIPRLINLALTMGRVGLVGDGSGHYPTIHIRSLVSFLTCVLMHTTPPVPLDRPFAFQLQPRPSLSSLAKQRRSSVPVNKTARKGSIFETRDDMYAATATATAAVSPTNMSQNMTTGSTMTMTATEVEAAISRSLPSNMAPLNRYNNHHLDDFDNTESTHEDPQRGELYFTGPASKTHLSLASELATLLHTQFPIFQYPTPVFLSRKTVHDILGPTPARLLIGDLTLRAERSAKFIAGGVHYNDSGFDGWGASLNERDLEEEVRAVFGV